MDPRVGAEQTLDGLGHGGVRLVAGQTRAQLGGHGLGQIARGEVGAGRGGVRRQPRLDELPAGGGVGERGEVVVVGGVADRAAELVEQGPRACAEDEAVGSGRQLLEEVGGRRSRAGHAGEFGFQVGDRGREPEGVAGPGQGDGATGPGVAFLGRRAVLPEELSGGTGGRLVAQEARALVQAQEGGEDQGRVVVVDTALVALVVGCLRCLTDQGGQVVGRCEGGGTVLVEQEGGEVFGTVDPGRLRGQRAVPVRAGRGEVGIGDRGAVVRPRQRDGQVLALGDEGEVKRLGVDREAVAAQADGAAVVGVQVGAVAQRAQGLLPGGLQAAVEFLRSDLVTE